MTTHPAGGDRPGGPEEPLTARDEALAAFILETRWVAPAALDELIRLVWSLEEVTDVGEFVADLMRLAGRRGPL